jgi:hypothetical protein
MYRDVSRRKSMRLLAYVAATALTLGGMTSLAQAEPGGCLKYGAVGAVGGHLAGHHAVLGAAGMYKRHEYKKHERQQLQAPSNG